MLQLALIPGKLALVPSGAQMPPLISNSLHSSTHYASGAFKLLVPQSSNLPCPASIGNTPLTQVSTPCRHLAMHSAQDHRYGPAERC